jgi:hypothetical protein
MHGPKNHLTIPVSVGGMDVAFTTSLCIRPSIT